MRAWSFTFHPVRLCRRCPMSSHHVASQVTTCPQLFKLDAVTIFEHSKLTNLSHVHRAAAPPGATCPFCIFLCRRSKEAQNGASAQSKTGPDATAAKSNDVTEELADCASFKKQEQLKKTPPLKLKRYKEEFDRIDLNKNGTICRKEAKALLQQLMGKDVTVEAAGRLVDAFDLDESGTLDFAEFLLMLTGSAEIPATDLFRKLDKTGNGLISKEELMAGLKVTAEEADKMTGGKDINFAIHGSQQFTAIFEKVHGN